MATLPTGQRSDAEATRGPALATVGMGYSGEIGVAVEQPVRKPHVLSGSSNFGDRIFSIVTGVVAALIPTVLVAIVLVLANQAWPTITKFGLSFVSSSVWDPSRDIYGALPAILGTVYSSLLALLLAAPIAVLTAIFLTEFAPLRLRFGLGFLIELLSAVPSIVYGLWALFVLVPIIRDYVEPPLIDRFGNSPLFSGYPLGLGMLTAALILAIMILPTITAISRDVMRAVPNHQREAMLALGATKWETSWKAVIPYARSGIIGGVMLGLARAVGETMAVQMVIGNSMQIGLSLVSQGTTLPATLVSQFSEATSDLNRAALMELALILMLVTVVLNIAARLLVWSVTRGRPVA